MAGCHKTLLKSFWLLLFLIVLFEVVDVGLDELEERVLLLLLVQELLLKFLLKFESRFVVRIASEIALRFIACLFLLISCFFLHAIQNILEKILNRFLFFLHVNSHI